MNCGMESVACRRLAPYYFPLFAAALFQVAGSCPRPALYFPALMPMWQAHFPVHTFPCPYNSLPSCSCGSRLISLSLYFPFLMLMWQAHVPARPHAHVAGSFPCPHAHVADTSPFPYAHVAGTFPFPRAHSCSRVISLPVKAENQEV